IDPKTKRAAVTLHVLLNDRDHHIFVDFLNLCEESQSDLNLENFITLLEDSGTGVNFDAWRQFADLPKFVLEPMVFEKELSEIDEVSESEKTVTTVNLPQNLVEFLNSESYSLTDLNARNGAGFTPLTRA